MLDEVIKAIPEIKKRDWIEWALLTGIPLLFSLYICYLYLGSLYYGIKLPGYLFALAFGSLVGAFAYVIDGLVHRALKKTITRLEHMVHYFILLGAGLPLWISLILAYWFGLTLMPFSLVFFFLQVYYTLFDETAFHWKRGIVAEQVVHWLILWGPGSAQIAWFYWAYIDHYAGLVQVLTLLGL